MFQSILVGVLIIAAAAYLGMLIYRSVTSPTCESGCGKCGTLDVDSIVKSMEEKKTST